MWRFVLKLLHLLKDISIRIVVEIKRTIIPLVRPPARLAIHRKGFLWREHAHDIFAAQVAISLRENPFIAEHHPPLEATLRTKCRRRRVHLCIEIKVALIHNEISRAVLAFLSLAHKLIIIYL